MQIDMKRAITIVSTLFIWAVSDLTAQEKVIPMKVEIGDEPAIVAGDVTITISRAIQIALENNQDLLSGAYSLSMSDSDYERFGAQYSTIISASGGVLHQKNPKLLWMVKPKKEDSMELSASIMKKFRSGTTIAGGFSQSNHKYNWQAIPNQPPKPESACSPKLFASVQQELLKNAFGYNERLQQSILKNNSQMEYNKIRYGLSLITVGVITDYWDLVIKNFQMNNSKLMVRETKRVRNIVAGNVRLGLLEKFQLNYWNAMVASSEAGLLNAKQNYRNSLRKFLQDVNLDPKTSMEGKVLLVGKERKINEEKALKTALEKRVDYRNALLNVKNAQKLLSIYSNEALPSLTGNITAATGDYDAETGDAYDHTLSMKYPRIDAKLTFTYPLDNKDQKVKERNAHWQVRQSKLQVEKYRRVVRDDIKSKVEQISTSYQLYRKARQSRYQAQLYYNRLVKNLRSGRFSASNVRDGLDGLINSREAELQSLVLYNVSLLQFKISQNTIFEDYGIDLKKYLPKEE